MSNLFKIFDKLAEERIREAIDRGDFDDLPGKGKPLDLEDDRHLPDDLRLAYKILKNAGCLPRNWNCARKSAPRKRCSPAFRTPRKSTSR